ncbi:hypothetical protein NW761_013883 [Fusarium oxysporum]|nr:hypothetical protein NW758_010306 [Fusarium oxysporum]KAJ4074271.1 hypothetical protein NW761_013883 [Fusarium oxysporum]KAJ4092729.1 hypothetical protein NW769_012724 [Fusarium oxysporum]KAJ4220271.1 hypothetical protein NW760_012191 [Fusarium oxysporum]
MPKYEFHVSTGAPTQANKAIRSHAIKTALQLRSKSVTGEDLPHSSAASAQTAQREKELKGQFRIKTASKKNPDPRPGATHQAVIRHDNGSMSVSVNMNQNCFSSNYSSRVQRFSVNILDPFGTIPIPSNPQIDTLLKHFMVLFDYLTTTVPSNNTWLGLAINDPLLMRVTLCTTAAFGATVTPSFSPELRKEGLKLKCDAIKDLNSLLQNGQVPENVLAAIAHLGHSENLEGSSQEADIHMRGLQALLDIRGGIKSINTYQVGRFINWVDLELATTRGRRPLYPLHYGLDRAKLPHDIVAACEFPTLSRLQSLGPAHKTVMTVIQLVRQRVMAVECGMDPTQRDVRALSFSAAFLALDQVDDIPITLEGQRVHTILLAVHLFLCAAMKQDFRWSGSLPWMMAQRLRESLETEPVYSEVWVPHLPELLWVLFVGAVVTEKHPQGHGTWFATQLQVVCQLLRCSTRLDFEDHLHSLVWDNRFGIEFLNNWFAPTLGGYYRLS